MEASHAIAHTPEYEKPFEPKELVELLRQVDAINVPNEGMIVEIPIELAELFYVNSDRAQVRDQLTTAIDTTETGSKDKRKAVTGYEAVMSHFRPETEDNETATVYDFAEQKTKREQRKSEKPKVPKSGHEEAAQLFFDEDYATLTEKFSNELLRPSFVDKMLTSLSKDHPEVVFEETEDDETLIVKGNAIDASLKVINKAGETAKMSNIKAVKEWSQHKSLSDNELFERYRVQVIAGLVTSERIDFNQVIEILCEMNAKFEKEQVPAISMVALFHGIETRLENQDSYVIDELKDKIGELASPGELASTKNGKRNGVIASKTQVKNLSRIVSGNLSGHLVSVAPKLDEYIQAL